MILKLEIVRLPKQNIAFIHIHGGDILCHSFHRLFVHWTNLKISESWLLLAGDYTIFQFNLHIDNHNRFIWITRGFDIGIFNLIIRIATRVICNMYNLQHVQFATRAIWRIPPPPLWKWRGPYLVSRVVPHLRGERGWVSCYSSGSMEGGCPTSAEVIEDTEDFIQLQGLL